MDLPLPDRPVMTVERPAGKVISAASISTSPLGSRTVAFSTLGSRPGAACSPDTSAACAALIASSNPVRRVTVARQVARD